MTGPWHTSARTSHAAHPLLTYRDDERGPRRIVHGGVPLKRRGCRSLDDIAVHVVLGAVAIAVDDIACRWLDTTTLVRAGHRHRDIRRRVLAYDDHVVLQRREKLAVRIKRAHVDLYGSLQQWSEHLRGLARLYQWSCNSGNKQCLKHGATAADEF